MGERMDALDFVFSVLDQPHRHHRHCVHNLSVDEQWEHWRIEFNGREATDEEMEMFGFHKDSLISITPDDWEIDVPELDFSRLSEDR